MIHWPEEVQLDLWSFALEYIVHLWNRLPKQDTGVTPIKLFSSTRYDLGPILRSSHIWGCLAYVLDPKVQDGKKLPRWQPKARRGQFLGYSKKHASNIALIRNVRTGSISSQFHIVFDEWFTTIPSGVDPENIPIPSNWKDLLQFSHYKY